MAFAVEFFGVRGTLPCAGDIYQRYGGSTSCVAVHCDDQMLIFDGGTGIFAAGAKLIARQQERISVFLTHVHWDHIQALPFFQPAFNPKVDLRIHAGGLKGEFGGLHKVLFNQMTQPYCPIGIDMHRGLKECVDFDRGDRLSPSPEIEVVTAQLNHPQGATGYRVNYQGHSICYVTDTEHTLGKRDPNVLELIAGADIVVYDAAYQDAIFENRIGWGHSTWEEGVRLCEEADAKNLFLFHHDPSSTDDVVDAIVAQGQEKFSALAAARQGELIDVARL